MPEIEFLIVADRAEVVNGKLYMVGGCWNKLALRDENHGVILSVVLSVRVSPEEATGQHFANIVIGARDQPPRAQAQIAFSSPSNLSQALPYHRALLAVPTMAITFPANGIYEVVANIEGTDAETRIPFDVKVGPQAPLAT